MHTLQTSKLSLTLPAHLEQQHTGVERNAVGELVFEESEVACKPRTGKPPYHLARTLFGNPRSLSSLQGMQQVAMQF